MEVCTCFSEGAGASHCLFSVLVHLGCYHKILQPGYLINNRHLFLTVLEAGSANQGTNMVDESLFGSHSLHLFAVFSRGGRDLFRAFFKAPISFKSVEELALLNRDVEDS